ncbi:MAG: GtrA family protein [Pseudomonadota bacterium]
MRHALTSEGTRFGLVGICAVLIDIAVYLGLHALGIAVAPAKAIGFLTGAAWAYAGNRFFTFRQSGGDGAFVRFAAVYAASLGVNVAVNAVALSMVSGWPMDTALAFTIATGASAITNFVGLKFAVFRTA